MLRTQKRLHSFLCRNILWFAMAAVIVVGIVLRVAYVPSLNNDLTHFNIQWLKEIKRGQIVPLIEVGAFNYSPLFLYMFKVATDLFPTMDLLLLCKLMSISAEVLVSLSAYFMVRRLRGASRFSVTGADLLCFAVCWLNPIMVLNGAYWGQTDCFYTLFCLWSVYLLIKQKPVWALVCFGIALAWKLQAILLLPLFVMMYLFACKKPFSILWFLLLPAIMLLSSIPMVLFDTSFLHIFRIYFAQASEHSVSTVLSYPNIYMLLGLRDAASATVYSLYPPLCVTLLAVLMIGFTARAVAKQLVPTASGTLLLGAWCVLICAFLLPKMHERYGMVGELLLVCYALVCPKPRNIVAAVLCVLATINVYVAFLYAPLFSVRLAALLETVAVVLVTYECFFSKPLQQGAGLGYGVFEPSTPVNG